MVDDAPQARVMPTYDFGNSIHRHCLGHAHDHSLEQQGESAAGSSPGHSHQVDSTLDPGDSGCKVGFMLNKVEMSPAFLLGIMGFETALTTNGADEGAASNKIDLDIEPLLLEAKF